jgi:diphosphomevalonate decarboxylase
MAVITESAPSNIALIKYMGKTEVSGNRPANASLSYTLEHLRSYVRLTPVKGADCWVPLAGYPEIKLSAKGLEKFLKHFQLCKNKLGIQGNFEIASANDFPSDCGLASSASSFAALTKAAYELARSQNADFVLPVKDLSAISRQGSGSSSRSFFSPWAMWRDEFAEPAELKLKLQHAVVIVEDRVKSVSSSEAHKRVTTSELFKGRIERAHSRLGQLLTALSESSGNSEPWRQAYELCWAEFWDMHALFETSQPSFGYLSSGSLEVLSRLRQVWQDAGDGPLVTMDAGPNVHLLLRADQTAQAEQWLKGLNTIKSWS